MTRKRAALAAFIIIILLLMANIAITVTDHIQVRDLINSRHTATIMREEENKEQQRNSGVNRALNVETWCEGKPGSASLNGIVKHDTEFITTISRGQLHYGLSPNDCLAVILATLQSGTQKPYISKKETPLVYMALQTPANKKLYAAQLKSAK